MAHYALLNIKNEVIRVIVGVDEGSNGRTIDEIEQGYAKFTKLKCKKTSYNTRGGVHILGGTPYRKNYAGIGFTYDESRDAFIPLKPEGCESWVLNEDTCLWEAPVERPEDNQEEGYANSWMEDSGTWEKVNIFEN